MPPRTWLVGFTRTAQLEPGDSTFVCMPIELSNFRLAASAGGGFSVLAGVYTLTIGGAPPGSLGTHVAESDVPSRLNVTLSVV